MGDLPTLLYRWIPRARSGFKSNGLIAVTTNMFIEFGYYTLEAGGRPMSTTEYLNPDKGVGGNITGFFEYEEHRPAHVLEAFPGKTTLANTYTYFGKNRDLLVVIPSEFPKTIEYVYGTLSNNDTPIVACPGMVKIAKLGGEMETSSQYGQESEWNFIPGETLQLPGYVVHFGNFDSENNFVPSEPKSFPRLRNAVQHMYERHTSSPPFTITKSVSAHDCDYHSIKMSSIRNSVSNDKPARR